VLRQLREAFALPDIDFAHRHRRLARLYREVCCELDSTADRMLFSGNLASVEEAMAVERYESSNKMWKEELHI
jgi:hypothetical protein